MWHGDCERLTPEAIEPNVAAFACGGQAANPTARELSAPSLASSIDWNAGVAAPSMRLRRLHLVMLSAVGVGRPVEDLDRTDLVQAGCGLVVSSSTEDAVVA